MKLVDILARELKVWPEPKSLLSGSADYCCQSDNTTEVYFGYGRTPIFLSRRAEDTEGVRVTRAEWQAAVDALKVAEGIADAEAGNLIPLDDVKAKYVEYSPAMHAQRAGRVTRVVAWNGEGLPPVGVVCDIYDESPHHHYEKHVGLSAEILAHTVSEEGGRVAVYKVAIKGESHYHALVAHCFRPIKTTEQVAAEEREKAAVDLFVTINWKDGRQDWERLSEGRKSDYFKAIDAGYRKQVAP